jgi:glycosylphosphatidylinositol transamidase (GPIT) subunit GPI8
MPEFTRGKDKRLILTKKQKANLLGIYNFFKQLGYDDNSIYVMAANALTESSLNEDSVSASGYTGLFQNSKDLHGAIVGQYGNHNMNTQL